jgi:hypothetical protein
MTDKTTEPFPQPSRNDGGEPCGECHTQPGETCDICGAVHAELCSWCGASIDPSEGTFNDDGGNLLCENCWEAADE